MITKQDLKEHLHALDKGIFIHENQEFQKTLMICYDILTDLYKDGSVNLEDI